MMYTLKNSPLYSSAFKIAKTLNEAGHRVLFAGGCVRDSILKIEAKDIDIATSATPTQVQELFEKTLPIGAQFGVIMVLIEKIPFEVATFRKDENYSDGRRPESVTFCDEVEDAKRRDFTINGLFYNPLTDEILDYVNGLQDIKENLIRTIGNPYERFTEDKLRLLRAIRFSAKLQFKIEQKTLNVIHELANEIKVVSRERIREEIFKILLVSKPSFYLNLIEKLNLWPPIFSFTMNIQNLSIVDQLKNFPPEIKLFSLNWKLNEKEISELGDLFKLSNLQIKNITNMLFFIKNFDQITKWRLAFLKKSFRFDHFDEILIFLEEWQKIIRPNDGNVINYIKENYKKYKSKIYVKKLITGSDLIKLGFTPSPLYKKIIEEIENLQLEKSILTKKDALEWIARGKYEEI